MRSHGTRSEAQPRQRPEMSGRTAARLLLGAGAAMVAIAVTIFTVAGWSRIGPLGRCAILLALTAGVLAAPRPLVRRSLRATAEAIAATGLVLTIGDAYLIHRFTGLRIGPLTAAALCAVGAAAWAAYGTAIRLRGPRLAAIGLAQLIAPLAFVGFANLIGGPAAPMAGPAAGLLVTAAADIVLAARLASRGRPQPDEPRGVPRSGTPTADVATIAAVLAWGCGVLAAVIGLAALITSQRRATRRFVERRDLAGAGLPGSGGHRQRRPSPRRRTGVAGAAGGGRVRRPRRDRSGHHREPCPQHRLGTGVRGRFRLLPQRRGAFPRAAALAAGVGASA